MKEQLPPGDPRNVINDPRITQDERNRSHDPKAPRTQEPQNARQDQATGNPQEQSKDQAGTPAENSSKGQEQPVPTDRNNKKLRITSLSRMDRRRTPSRLTKRIPTTKTRRMRSVRRPTRTRPRPSKRDQKTPRMARRARRMPAPRPSGRIRRSKGKTIGKPSSPMARRPRTRPPARTATRPRPPLSGPARHPGKTAICRPSRVLRARARARTPVASRRVKARVRAASHLRAARGTREFWYPVFRHSGLGWKQVPGLRREVRHRLETASPAARPRGKAATRAGRARRANAGRPKRATARIPARGPAKVRVPRARAANRIRATRLVGKAALPRRGPAAASSPSRVPRGIGPAPLVGRSQVAANPQASPARETNRVARDAARSAVVAPRGRARPERRPRTTANLRHGPPTLKTRRATTSLRKASRKPIWCSGRSRICLPRMPSHPISRRRPG